MPVYFLCYWKSVGITEVPHYGCHFVIFHKPKDEAFSFFAFFVFDVKPNINKLHLWNERVLFPAAAGNEPRARTWRVRPCGHRVTSPHLTSAILTTARSEGKQTFLWPYLSLCLQLKCCRKVCFYACHLREPLDPCLSKLGQCLMCHVH
jgi:hypothetical protein